jgi:1-acyl-sn-glycerol-3-phosphate acyltransferase
MATKGVLGNDPFQRGAAKRPTESQASEAREELAKAKAKAAKKAKPTGGKAAKKAAPAGAGTERAKTKPAPEVARTVATPAVHAARTVATPAVHEARTVAMPAVETGGKGRVRKAAKAPKPTQGRKSGRPTPVTEEAQHLREPAAPETPRRRPPARVPVIQEPEDDTQARTPEEREVDRVLATAVAVEAAEAAAEAAAEIAVDTLLTLQAQQAAATAREGTAPETWSRELATAVVAEAAEAAAGAILEAALTSAMPSAAGTNTSLEERTILSSALAELEAADAEAEAGPTERTIIDRAYAEPVIARDYEEEVDEVEPEDLDDVSAQAAREAELEDLADDEYPTEREIPISGEFTSGDREPAREPFFTDQVGREAEPVTAHTGGMLSLAKEIALQALTSAATGKALGAAQGLVGALRAGLGTSGSTSLDEYGRDAELVGGLQPLLDFLYERYWRVSVQGGDLVPTRGAILVANHSGALPYDGLVASQALLRERPDLREPRWLVEDQVFHAPVLGTLFNRLGAVRACPENALRLLDEQRPVLVFPEGYQGMSKPFAQRYQLKRFGRGGFVKLALRTGAPIIPVAIVGAEETSPLLGRIPAGFLGVPYVPLTSPMPLPARWTLRFGEPISMAGLGPEAADDLAEVQRLTERTREAIMGMLQALLRERRSVFTG